VKEPEHYIGFLHLSSVYGVCLPIFLLDLWSISLFICQEPCCAQGTPRLVPLCPPLFPFPFLTRFPPLFPRQQKKGYNATGPPPPPLSTLLSPPLPFVLVPSSPVTFGPPVPLPSSPLSPTPAFFPSLHAAPPCLSPLLVASCVSPRLPFPSTIWTLIPALLTTSAEVFLAEGVLIRGWWVFFPCPPFFVIGVLSRPVISKSTIYDFTIKASRAITVHRRFEYCSLIARHSSSR
jgi:hypothetical protein